jgi:predicted homoserine dehydrogenase-like protein
MIYQHLFDRVMEPTTVRAGLIGAGDFGTPIATQATIIPRLDVPVVADIDIEAARRAFRLAGVDEEDIVVAENRSRALRALERGKYVVLQDAMLMMELPLLVIATATRVPEAGAHFAYEAIQHGKHVIMIDKEADSVVGPILKHLADRAGLVYSTDDGDQPGLLMGLVSWARSLGLEVLCGGNLHSGAFDSASATVTYHNRTVQASDEDRWALEPMPGGQAPRYAAARRRIFAEFKPYEETGDTICHMAVSANGSGLLPDTPVGHRPIVRYGELPEVLCPAEDGGILHTRGAVDIPSLLCEPGEPDGGGGVFIVIANDDPVSREVMIDKGLLANSTRSAMLVYRPYHLCGAETAMSILCAGLLRLPTGSSEILPRVDMGARAVRDIRAGEVLGDPSPLGLDREVSAFLLPGAPTAADHPIPFFMLDGNRPAVDVPEGTVITRSMVTPPQDSVLWSLRHQQDMHFFDAGVPE